MTLTKPEPFFLPDVPDWSFGPFCLRPDGTLLRDAAEVRLPPQELAILRLLLANAGRIVSSEELRVSIWGDVHVSIDSLPRCVSSLRSHLQYQDCIRTVYKRGYRIMLAVRQTAVAKEKNWSIERRKVRPISPPRLVILPFATLDGVPVFFGAGIAEETMIRLGRSRNPVAELMARDSVFALAARGATALDVGVTLGADLAVAGSISALPMHFRLRAEMIRVGDGVQLWIEDFLIPRNMLASADASVAERIAARIRNSFVEDGGPASGSNSNQVTESAAGAASAVAPRQIISRNPQTSPGREARCSKAYSVYLQACGQCCGLWHTLERQSMHEAMRGFQHALELDPTMLSARTYLVHGYLAQSSLGYMRGDIAAELARKQAEIVLSHSGNGQSLHPALGWINFHHDRDFSAAAEALARPQRPAFNLWTTIFQVRVALGQGRFVEASTLLRLALEADPFSPMLHGRLAWVLHLSGDSRAALEAAKRAQKLFPDHLGTMFFCSIVFAAAAGEGDSTGELATRAAALAIKLTRNAPYLDAGYATLAYVQARQGRIMEARDLLDRQKWLSRERFVMRSFHAPALVELGEFDAAIETLAVADQQHCPWLFELLADPRLRPLHSEAGFQRLNRLCRRAVSAGESVA